MYLNKIYNKTMVKSLKHDDQIRLSLLDIRILSVLLKRRANAYELVKLCQKDAVDEPKFSYGSISRTLNRLEKFYMVESSESHHPGHTSRTYSIAGFGQEFLGEELKRLKELVSQVEYRLHLKSSHKTKNLAQATRPFM